MKRKKDDDPRQSSLDSFANIELPSMPDLDKLAKADKILKENQKNEPAKHNRRALLNAVHKQLMRNHEIFY